MGRQLKRVPLDFDYPINRLWVGYLIEPSYCIGRCEDCRHYARIQGIPFTDYECPEFEEHYKPDKTFDPPTGEGFQLWNTTTEGHPESPVFSSLEALASWCEDNATIFGFSKATKDEWLNILAENNS